ncbi:MAG: glycosyltransferase [Bacteroidia bacterium]|nr:glycosyltransferase [Bacteroidia bacterium]
MKILFLTSRFPYPLEKGDKLRSYHFIKGLSRNHEVHLASISDIPVSDNDMQQVKKFCSSIKVFRINKPGIAFNIAKAYFGKLPLQTAYFFNTDIQKQITAYGKSIAPDIIVCMLTRMAEYAEVFTGIPKLLDYQDVFSKGVERRMGNTGFFLRSVLQHEASNQLQYERNVFDMFDEKIIISSQDRNLIPHPLNSSIHIITNGVDTEYFSPQPSEKKYDLLFTGNMNYPPNIESADYLVNEILPHVRKRIPGVSLLIAGANPSARVRKLQSETVHVSGWVDDIRASYASARIFIAPMLINIGLQNKILEAMAMNLPCITSPLANNAIGGADRENILVAASPQQYAEKIFLLNDDNVFARSIAEKGNEFVKKNYTWERSIERLEHIINRMAERN